MISTQFHIDPFQVAVSIASLCMFVYRLNLMPENSIGIVPFLGYRKNERQSLIAIKWLKWLSHTTAVNIQHKMNGGEVTIGRFKVDGQSRDDRRSVYEFNGCLWHGCPTVIQIEATSYRWSDKAPNTCMPAHSTDNASLSSEDILSLSSGSVN